MKARYITLYPLMHWRRTQRPIAWSRRFGRVAPIEVEIGFGNGEYLVRQALEHPHVNFVGIELEWASIQRCLRKIAQAQATNIRLLQVNANVAFERLFGLQSIDRVYALFPSPWPKERHAKNRLFSHVFLKLVNSRLRSHGELQIVTDDDKYSSWIQRQSVDSGFAFVRHRVAPQFSTKYERKWQAQGQQLFYQLSLSKQSPVSISVRKDVALQVHRVHTFDADQFHPTDLQGEITIKFKDLLYDHRQKRAMQWVYIVEDHLCQDLWIDITHGDDGWLIRPSRGSTFIPTKGLQQALDSIHQAIELQGHKEESA